MKNLYFILLLFFCNAATNTFAQDAYYNNLATTLQNDYNLPSGEWLLYDTENATFSAVVNWGISKSVINVTGQDFETASQVVVNQAGNNPWDAGWKMSNTVDLQQGEKVLMVFWIRSEGGTGEVNVFAERQSDFSKEIYLTVPITEEWTPLFIPFETTLGPFSAGQLDFGFHLGNQAQTIQIGGYAAIKYPASVPLEDLPSDYNNDQYEGYELDAPWRATAADRINQFRKSNLTIEAVTSNGDPIPNASFDIQMTRHEFAFGSAVTAERLAGNNNHNIFYENKIKDLDGKGHGFNWVVFENDLKWDGWEEEWFVSHAELVNAVTWLNERDIQIRGHNLVWTGWQYLPDDLQQNTGDATYIWNRIEGRLDEILNYPGLENIPEWDVLNEIVVNTSLESTFATIPGNTTGREVYADIFNRARQISPETKLYLNDYVTMTLGNTGGGQYDILKARIQELLDAGAPVDGIGFQAHIGGFPNGIPSVLGTLDDFYDSFGLTAKITEFDLPPSVSEELGANYLRDFMTAIFSHESVDGFLFWNFWDGATWQNPGANLFRQDWSRTPAGDMFVDLVFNQWWTDSLMTTESDGKLSADFFKGTHKITYVCDGQTITETINLVNDETITITCDNLSTSFGNVVAQALEKELCSVYPNPTNDFLTIKKQNREEVIVILYNSLGEKVLEKNISNPLSEIQVSDLKGVYFLEIKSEENRFFEKVIIE